ncbi:MAG: toll/interleukin-1 receptor domain-containing protein [Verrucomicrobiota bacterium]
MPVFINYSHKDREFVTRLAANLVRNKANVWLDEWEVAAGESLIENIQSAIQGASALIAVFSKASVASVWCKREVTAAIQKELEERRVIVIPALLEDCEIPLFLRDKKYADFRTNFDVGLQSVLVGIAKVTNASLGRIEADEYYTDWSIDWGYLDGQFLMEFTLVQHSVNWPYTVLSTILILCSKEATTRYEPYEEAGLSEVGHLIITESVLAGLDGHEFQVLLEDSHRKRKEIGIQDPNTGIG